MEPESTHALNLGISLTKMVSWIIRELNVQRIMERLGGGGHHTMAGAQIKDKPLDEIVDALKVRIEEYSNKTL